MKLFVTFSLVFFMCSCANVKETEIITLLQNWEGHEITFHDNHVFTILGKDTIAFPFQDGYKILTYVDSVGCIGCKLQLTEWKKYIMEMDSLFDNSIQFLFFFSPEKKVDIIRTLLLSHFDYPVCIDEQDSLNKLNDFPTEMAFHTFLLDKSNKIIAIGNPIHNPKIKELYLKIIQGGEVKPDNRKLIIQTEVSVDKYTISLGHFDWQEKQKASFVLKNIGKTLLVIQDVNASCGCTEVTYSKEPIQPGGSVVLDVGYKAETPGSFDKTITVYCNANSSPIVLRITGNADGC